MHTDSFCISPFSLFRKEEWRHLLIDSSRPFENPKILIEKKIMSLCRCDSFLSNPGKIIHTYVNYLDKNDGHTRLHTQRKKRKSTTQTKCHLAVEIKFLLYISIIRITFKI